MFSDEVLEKILCRREIMKIPCEYKSDMLRAVEEVLKAQNMLKDKEEDYATIHEPELF